MDEVQEQFEDPALRSAIRRACAKQPAPWGLREKVSAMMASAAAPVASPESHVPDYAPRPSGWRLSRPSSKLVAAAAVAFLGLGIAGYQFYETFGDMFVTHAPPPPAKFEDSFATSIVRAHQNCAKLNDHHIVPGEDFDALRMQLSTSIGIKIFAAALGDGFAFKGAGMCKVGEVNAVHMFFTRGDEQVSIFSMPMEQVSCHPATYAQTVGDQVLAGFTEGNGLYVVVESVASGKRAELEKAQMLMRTVQKHMCSSACSTQPKL